MKKKGIKGLIVTCMATMLLAATVFAASETLNGGGATWSGGEDSDGILFSQLRDNKQDGVRYEVNVWVQSDDGVKKEKFGTTNGVGQAGQVRVSKAATHSNPFVVEQCGYNSFKAISAN